MKQLRKLCSVQPHFIFIYLIAMGFMAIEVRAHDVEMNDMQLGVIDEIDEDAQEDLPIGLHLVSPARSGLSKILIAVHDTEWNPGLWVESLKRLHHDTTHQYLLRWDTDQCPGDSGNIILDTVEYLLEQEETVDQVTLIGHGLGGIVLSQLVDQWKLPISTDIHLVDAPLGGWENPECGDALPKRIPGTVRLFQWRTPSSTESSDSDYDPPIVDLKGSLVVTLPNVDEEDTPITESSALMWVTQRIEQSMINEELH